MFLQRKKANIKTKVRSNKLYYILPKSETITVFLRVQRVKRGIDELIISYNLL